MSAQVIGAGSGLAEVLRLASGRAGDDFARRNESTTTGRVQGDSTPAQTGSRTLATVSVADALELTAEARALAASAAESSESAQVVVPKNVAEQHPFGTPGGVRNPGRLRVELREMQSRTVSIRNLKPVSELLSGLTPPGRVAARTRSLTLSTAAIGSLAGSSGGALPENLQETLDWLEGANPALHKDLLVLLKTLGNEDDAARILRGVRRLRAARSTEASGEAGGPDSTELHSEQGVASFVAGGAPEHITIRAELEAGITLARIEVDRSDGSAEAANLQLVEVEGRVEIRLVFGDPLVLDLAGDGIDLRSVRDGATFDIAGTGRAVQTAFVQGDDAFLFRDTNGDGLLTDGRELFGDQEGDAHGFAELARHDDNADGVIDARDAIWSELRLYQDLDGDGQVGADETRTLGAAGVSSLGLAYQDASQTDRHGNRIAQSGAFTRTDGSRGALVDALLLHTH